MSTRDLDLDPFLAELERSGLAPESAIEALASALPEGTLTPALRARLLATVAAGGRLARFAAEVARLLDVAADRAKELLDGIDRATSWAASPLPGIELYDLSGGPAVAGAITGFIRLRPGSVFPPHEHVGRETVFVVQGSLRDSAGVVVRPGEIAIMEAGTEHSFVVLPGPDLVYLAVVQDGLRIGGELYGPGDPRI